MAEQIQRLQRRVTEQVLARGEAAPQWKRQLLEDPATALSTIPEAMQLDEIYKRPPEDPIPPTPNTAQEEEYRQLSRSLTQKILDRAESDPTWKQQLLNDPDVTLREANFPELKRLDEISQMSEAEVQGHLDD